MAQDVTDEFNIALLRAFMEEELHTLGDYSREKAAKLASLEKTMEGWVASYHPDKVGKKGFKTGSKTLAGRVDKLIAAYNKLNDNPDFRSGSNEAFSPSLWSLLGKVRDSLADVQAAEDSSRQQKKDKEDSKARKKERGIEQGFGRVLGNAPPLSLDVSSGDEEGTESSDEERAEKTNRRRGSTHVDIDDEDLPPPQRARTQDEGRTADGGAASTQAPITQTPSSRKSPGRGPPSSPQVSIGGDARSPPTPARSDISSTSSARDAYDASFDINGVISTQEKFLNTLVEKFGMQADAQEKSAQEATRSTHAFLETILTRMDSSRSAEEERRERRRMEEEERREKREEERRRREAAEDEERRERENKRRRDEEEIRQAFFLKLLESIKK